MMKLIAFLAALILPSLALAQTNSSPGWSYGYVPTVAQWNAVFAGKVDAAGGQSTNQLLNTPTVTGELTISNSSTIAGQQSQSVISVGIPDGYADSSVVVVNSSSASYTVGLGTGITSYTYNGPTQQINAGISIGTSSTTDALTLNGSPVSAANSTGSAPLGLSVGTSPYAYTASVRGAVAVSGGTVSAITITRGGAVVQTGVIAGMFPVLNGDIVTVTYSAVPTMDFISE